MTSHKNIEEASFAPTKEFRNYVLDVVTKASKNGINIIFLTKAVEEKFRLVPKIALNKLIANALEWWEESAEIVQVKGNVYKLTKWVTEQTKEVYEAPESHDRKSLEKLSVTRLRELLKKYTEITLHHDLFNAGVRRAASETLATIRGILRAKGAGSVLDEAPESDEGLYTVSEGIKMMVGIDKLFKDEGLYSSGIRASIINMKKQFESSAWPVGSVMVVQYENYPQSMEIMIYKPNDFAEVMQHYEPFGQVTKPKVGEKGKWKGGGVTVVGIKEGVEAENKIYLMKTMKISTTPGQSAFQTLYRHGFNHYIVSYSTIAGETMIFKADKTGKVTNWLDLWVERKKTDHNEAITDYLSSVKGNRDKKLTVVEDVSSESVSEISVDMHEENEPTDPALWSKAKSLAKSKFRVYPSAYANGWAAKWYKEHGGGWRKAGTKESFTGKQFSKFVAEADQVDKESMPCNKPRSSTRPGKKRMVKGCQDGEEKIVHYGADGYGHNYSDKARESFRARHNCDQAKDKLSAQYWACKDLWAGKGGSTKSCPGGKGDSDCKY